MIKEYKKGKSVSLSKHFNSTEFDCHCINPSCTVTYVDTDLIDKLEVARMLLGDVIEITSGFRCVSHNKVAGGKIGSYHLQGKAADISASTVPLAKVRSVCEIFDGLGKARTFTHVDVRGYKARWVY